MALVRSPGPLGALPVRGRHNFCEQTDREGFSDWREKYLFFLFLVTYRFEATLNAESPGSLRKLRNYSNLFLIWQLGQEIK